MCYRKFIFRDFTLIFKVLIKHSLSVSLKMKKGNRQVQTKGKYHWRINYFNKIKLLKTYDFLNNLFMNHKNHRFESYILELHITK